VEVRSKPNPSFFDIVMSVLASMFGVQSSANYRRDFTSGTVTAYVVVGVLMFVLFILSILGLVAWVIPDQG